uniref:Ubiquitin carboxyl-terminal hydrolase n=1 Tax=Strongyloides stercoralis TaxID=6248 RepID=A0A0K0EAN6_STRER
MVQQINANGVEIKVPTQGNPVIELKPMNDENTCKMKLLNGTIIGCHINGITTELDFIDSNVSPSREVKNGSVPEAQQRQCNKNKFEVSVNSVGLYTNPVSTDSPYVHNDVQGPEGIQVSCPSTLKTIYTKKSERVLKSGKKPKRRYENTATFIPESIDNYFGNKPVSEVITLITEEEKTPELVEKTGKGKNKKKKNKHGKNTTNEKVGEIDITVKESSEGKCNNKSDDILVEESCESVSVDVSVNLVLNGKSKQTVTSPSPLPKSNESVDVSTTLPVSNEGSSTENDFMVVSKNKKRSLNNNVSNDKKQKNVDNHSDGKKKVNRSSSSNNNQKNKSNNNKDGGKKESSDKTTSIETKTIIKQSATVEDRENFGKTFNNSSQNTWAHIVRPKNNNLNGCSKDGSTDNSLSTPVEGEKKRVTKDMNKKAKLDDKIAPSVLKVFAQHKNNKSKNQLSTDCKFLKVTTLNQEVLQIPLVRKATKKTLKLEVNSEHYEYVKFLQNAWNESIKKIKVTI